MVNFICKHHVHNYNHHESKTARRTNLLKCICFMTLIAGVTSLPPVIRIGAIFTEDQKDSSTELAFKYAVYRINKDKAILPKTQLVYDIEYVPRDDSFRTSKKVCRQMESGVQAIFGPSDPLLGAHIQSICEALDIPHVEARIDLDTTVKEFSINLHPSQQHMNTAYRDLMVFLNWTKVAIVYEENYGLFKQQELMKSTPTSKTEMYIRQATPDTYRQILREIRQKEIYKLIVDTNPVHINAFFRAILQLQMNDYRYHYMFTTFDIETFDLEDFKYNSVNITAFRLVDVESQKYSDILEQMKKFQHSGRDILNGSSIIQTEPALIFDSVYAFAAGLAALDRGHTLTPKNLSCDYEEPWKDGLSLYNYINAASIRGLTGKVEFIEGKRNNFKIDLLKLKKEHIEKVGYWSPNEGINVTDPTAFYDTNATNITLIVMTREEKPYVMVKLEKNLTGNARFEGFCIDLLKGIAAQVGFQYQIRLVPDRMYGVFDPETKKWNGIVRELMERRADLAVASMTINYARESVIDFTKPFMNLGIGILFKKSERVQNRFFSFMNPLAVEIWFYIAFAYVLVSLTIWIVARFSPFEWQLAKPPCGMACEHILRERNKFLKKQSEQLCPHGLRYDGKFHNRMIQRQGSLMQNFEEDHDTMDEEEETDQSAVRKETKRSHPAKDRDQHELDGEPKEDADDQCASNAALILDNTNDEADCVDENNILDFNCPEGSSGNQWKRSFLHENEDFNENSLECDSDHEMELTSIVNEFTLRNSFWFAIGTLMQQGSDLYPKATSTRIVGGIWWFFTLIIISSYTANLAAFLTVERMITPIESAADLAEQTDISYGTLEGGSTMTFFRDSKIGIYQKMWRFMESKKPSVFVKTYEEGINRVLDGNYAFLMESTMLDYAVQRDCNLTQIGGLLDSKGYGIATPKGSPWRDIISLAILELQEKGVIQILYDKWWKNTGDVCNRDDKSKESKANALGVENIGGVFVVLLCGLALAVVVAILEFCWNSKKNAQTERQSLCSEMAEELRFAMHCHASKQRPALKRNCTKCSPGTTYVPGGIGMAHLNGVHYNFFN